MRNLIKHLINRLWLQGKRFPFAVAGLGLFFLFWGILIGQDAAWVLPRQWNLQTQGMLASYTMVWLSVPWKLYRESRHMESEMNLRGEGANLLAFLILWRYLQHQEVLSSYALLAFGFVPVFCLSLILYLTQQQHRDRDVLPYFLIAFLKCLGMTFLLQLVVSTCLFGFSFLLHMVAPAWQLFLSGLCQLGVGFLYFLSYIPREEDTLPEHTGYVKCWRRLLLPGVCVLLLILYLYLGKIVWLRTMPVGLLNWFASIALFVYAFFYFSFSQSSEFWAHKVLQWGGLALVPVLMAQGMAVHIRIDAYGLTTLRYLSLVLTFYGILVLTFGLGRRRPDFLYLVAAVLTVLLTLTPANLIDVPAYSQYKRLSKVLMVNGLYQDGQLQRARSLSAGDNKTLRSAYGYLASTEGRWRYPVVEQLRQEKYIATLPKPQAGSPQHLSYVYFRNSITTEGRCRIYHLIGKRVSAGKVTVKGEKGDIELDLTEYLRQLVRQYPSGGSAGDEAMTFTQGKKTLYIVRLSGPRDAFAGEGKNVIILEGFLVVKE